jgi:hypothetical protein
MMLKGAQMPIVGGKVMIVVESSSLFRILCLAYDVLFMLLVVSLKLLVVSRYFLLVLANTK